MFFGAELEIAIKLGTFKNIQIKQPCVLQVRLSIHHQDPYKGIVTAVPISIIPMGKDTQKQVKSELNHSDNTYLSDRIPIRFQQCLTNLNEICIFKTMIDAVQPNYKQDELILLAQLLLIQQNKLVTLIEYQAKTNSLFQHAYLPILFDNIEGRYTSSLQIEFHSQLIGYKFIDNSSLIKQLIEIQNKKNQQKHISKQGGALKLPKQFKLFKDFLNFFTNNYKQEYIQRFYDGFVGELRESVRKLKIFVKQYINLLDQTQHQHTLQMNIIRKLSQPIPEPHHIKNLNKNSLTGSSILSSSFKNIHQTVTNKRKKDSISQNYISSQFLEQCILKDFNVLSKILYQLWREFIKLETEFSNSLFTKSLKQKYFFEIKKYYMYHNVFIEGYNLPQSYVSLESSVRTNNKYITSSNILNLQQNAKESKKRHLIVIVHGFQACSLDLEGLRNLIVHLYPKCEVLLSSSNESRTQKSIQILGQRLALEVKNHINSQCGKYSYKISFIAHSLGGIIVRSALEYLMYYKDSFGSYISLSSPHLGYLFHTSTLIKTSLWVLNKMNKCQSLMQLTFQDTPKLQDSFLYKLSSKPGMQFFQSIILQSSTLDQYVPYSSARLQLCPQVKNSPENSNSMIYKTMLKGILNNVNSKKIVRINIQFSNLQQDFNTMIGRTAHIQLLSDFSALKTFLISISDVFN